MRLTSDTIILSFPKESPSPEVVKEIPIRAGPIVVRQILTGQRSQFCYPITKPFSSQVCKGIGRMTYGNKVYRSCAWFEERDPRANGPQTMFVKCPFGQSEDRLWVQEPFAYDATGQIIFEASPPPNCDINWDKQGKKKARRLTKEQARLWLHIDWIRVARPWNITKADCRAMGIQGEDRYLIRRFRKWYNENFGPKAWEILTWMWIVEFSVLMPAVPPPVHQPPTAPTVPDFPYRKLKLDLPGSLPPYFFKSPTQGCLF